MIAAIGAYLRHIPQLVGVELLLADGETFVANTAVVKRTGTTVHFVRGEYGLASFGAVKEQVQDGMPIVLIISGKGIIHRAIAKGQRAMEGGLLKQVLPNAKPDDFYLQHTELETCTMLSVVRRKLVDDLIAQLAAQGLVLLGAGLGPFAMQLFSEYLFPVDSEGCVLGRHRLALHQGTIIGYELLPLEAAARGKRVDMAGEQLNEWVVPAFAAAFAEISDIPFAQLPIQAVQEKAADYRQQGLFRRSGAALMAFFLVLLLGNAFFFMHYSDNVAGFAGSDALAIQQEIDVLRQQAAERETLLEGLWYADVPRWRMAYMADRIAATLPDGMLLNEMAIYPRDEGLSRKQRRPVHTPSAIRIKGTCGDMPTLNGWIKQVRGLPFCETVEIDEYGFDGREEVGTFVLSLTLNP
ncbi:hypothetical protein [Parapedobacter koreensis]|uniref:Tfp pilus assembly protein PilN n=1 Tax=Parapedobacter koreensis TaxID=332977 RepID=A0A1H7UF18_9SPHI|nr:hypothetical protein [Parapedobacter koreensis]SEL95650.1 hypothetical protein SAMN05421740_11537 [Parapedobacter koreensis]